MFFVYIFLLNPKKHLYYIDQRNLQKAEKANKRRRHIKPNKDDEDRSKHMQQTWRKKMIMEIGREKNAVMITGDIPVWNLLVGTT